MNGWPSPAPLFNPITAGADAGPAEVLAGPLGLVVFLPLIPLVLRAGRRWPRTALIAASVAWLLPTLQPPAFLILTAGVAAALAYLRLLTCLRTRGVLGARGMIALVWIGLHALAFPLWWQAQWWWWPSRLAALHTAGFSYFLLRLVAWGVDLARAPAQPWRWADTIAWLTYPPSMRLAPFHRRNEFLPLLDTWHPRRAPQFRAGLVRFGWCVLGAFASVAALRGLAIIPADGTDFFAAPQNYTTRELLRVFYLVPVYIYLLLWTYAMLAAAAGRWIGLPVHDNFHYLPAATSVRDFWRRWNVTVGAFLRDYVYIPLGGNRRRVYLNYLLVFGYCGVWHGASWSFLAWGLSQGAALAVQRFWDRLRARTGLDRWLRGPLWVAFCWLLTMHYQAATIVMFADFDHLGLRMFAELARRLLPAAAS